MSVSLKHWRGCRCKPFCRWFYAPVFQHFLQGMPAFRFAMLLFVFEKGLGVMAPQSMLDSSLSQAHGAGPCSAAPRDCLAQDLRLPSFSAGVLPSQSPQARANKVSNALTATVLVSLAAQAALIKPDADSAAKPFKTLQTLLKTVFSQPCKAPERRSPSVRGVLTAPGFGSTHHATAT